MSRNKQEIIGLETFIKKEKLKIKVRHGWENFSKNIQLPDALVLDVDNINSLQTIVRKIDDLNKNKIHTLQITYRVAAGGKKTPYSESFSFTPGAEANIIFRLTGKSFCQLEKTSTENVMRVGASIQIGTLNELLYKNHGLVLPTASLITYPTVGGLSANAGHGTGRDQPGFAGLFTSMTFMIPNGKIITLSEEDPEFKILCGAHLGLPGILLNAELKCIKAKKLRCVIDVCSLADFLDAAKDGLFFKTPYTSVMYVPTYYPDELTNRTLKNVVIYTFEPVSLNKTNKNNNPVCAHFTQSIGISIEEQSHITDLLSLKPALIPLYMRHLITRGAIGEKDKLVIGDWPSVWHYQTAFPRKINDIDVLFPVSDNSQEIIDAFTTMAKVNEKYAQNGEYPVTYAAYARFISGTNGGLSTSSNESGKHICGFDIVSSPNLPGYKAYRDEMFNYMVNHLGGKPHWGKYAPEDLDYQEMYGKSFTEFMNTIECWYKKYDMDFFKSPLLNHYLCHIMGIPKYTPFTEKSATHFAMPTVKAKSASDMAKVVLKLIDGDDEDTIAFRKELQVVAIPQKTVRFFQSAEQKQNIESQSSIDDSLVVDECRIS